MTMRCFSIIIALLFFSVCFSHALAAEKAADFTLPDINGNKVSLSAFKGKVVILNFWATWCSSCRAEMPSLNNLYNSFRDRGLVVISVSTDKSEKAVKAFATKANLSFSVLVDKNREVSFDEYGVFGLPVTFLIDKNGLIIEKFMGETEWDSGTMREKISRIIGGKK
ncbi:MAG: TlpA family protein disulfide reductase [Nitrospirae bacterium]|nr:MAG: TlpA family protein disulfide reductase [Nitrospirota bacterium]